MIAVTNTSRTTCSCPGGGDPDGWMDPTCPVHAAHHARAHREEQGR
ncbi:hypothetical protein [Actinoalloteichus sp. GBA129-24]|nr:hypothetical protein [Actinoalloteichus sp. GBA129-24]